MNHYKGHLFAISPDNQAQVYDMDMNLKAVVAGIPEAKEWADRHAKPKKSLLAGFISALNGNLSLRAFLGRHESTLKDIHRRPFIIFVGFLLLGFFFLKSLFSFFLFSNRVQSRGLAKFAHRFCLTLVMVYTFVFFNPQANMSSAKSNEPVYCPDGYAYQLKSGHYIRCENFDEFHLDEVRGRTRTDLYLTGGQ